jgi:hypothetical protein
MTKTFASPKLRRTDGSFSSPQSLMTVKTSEHDDDAGLNRVARLVMYFARAFSSEFYRMSS